MMCAKSHPILFRGEMVRAILNGTKTQSRRIVKPQPIEDEDGTWKLKQTSAPNVRSFINSPMVLSQAPYQKGDHLWVRETLKLDETENVWKYGADNVPVLIDYNGPSPAVDAMMVWAHHKQGNTCVSIHMPEWASRITLEVLNVCIERLQDISEEDAIAEGVGLEQDGFSRYITYEKKPPFSCDTPSQSFQTLWTSINGIKSWDDNPWVWVYEFRKMER